MVVNNFAYEKTADFFRKIEEENLDRKLLNKIRNSPVTIAYVSVSTFPSNRRSEN